MTHREKYEGMPLHLLVERIRFLEESGQPVRATQARSIFERRWQAGEVHCDFHWDQTSWADNGYRYMADFGADFFFHDEGGECQTIFADGYIGYDIFRDIQIEVRLSLYDENNGDGLEINAQNVRDRFLARLWPHFEHIAEHAAGLAMRGTDTVTINEV